jgi:hypothetical protein
MNKPSEDDMIIARATLLLLTASVKGASADVHYRFGAVETSGVTDRLVELLAEFPKPAYCLGSVRGATLEITCNTAGPYARARDVDSLIGRIWEGAAGMTRSKEGAMLLLRGGSTSLLFPLRCFRRWFDDYRLQDYSMSMEFNDEEADARGAIVAVSIGPPPAHIRVEIE